jgi:hypothetical protein
MGFILITASIFRFDVTLQDEISYVGVLPTFELPLDLVLSVAEAPNRSLDIGLIKVVLVTTPSSQILAGAVRFAAEG